MKKITTKINYSSRLPVRFFIFPHSFFVTRKLLSRKNEGKSICSQNDSPNQISRLFPHLIFTIELTIYTEYIIIKAAIAHVYIRLIILMDRRKVRSVYKYMMYLCICLCLFTKLRNVCWVYVNVCMYVIYAGARVGLGWGFKE